MAYNLCLELYFPKFMKLIVHVAIANGRHFAWRSMMWRLEPKNNVWYWQNLALSHALMICATSNGKKYTSYNIWNPLNVVWLIMTFGNSDKSIHCVILKPNCDVHWCKFLTLVWICIVEMPQSEQIVLIQQRCNCQCQLKFVICSTSWMKDDPHEKLLFKGNVIIPKFSLSLHGHAQSISTLGLLFVWVGTHSLLH